MKAFKTYTRYRGYGWTVRNSMKAANMTTLANWIGRFIGFVFFCFVAGYVSGFLA